ncbi:Mu transposase C-terminal domain-containing protein [Flavobacterium channae]|uniref:Mu transposase C-terminal domain-containing protein n=1 Tax=Flavobacterium channae TaxID=2897181 RepID=UPI001E586DEA|nr:Mu transposase C-terminal domain-containing protein [Flavobacterium channae]UGS24643.1 Mu transposase C-terminal domain-containing protein [Flavobacterium channae]
MDIVNLTKGEKVIYNDKEVIITKLNTLDTVTIEELSNGTNHLVHVSDLKPIFKKKEKLEDINVISEKKWELAQQRFEIITPILEKPGNIELVKQISAEKNVSIATLYRWIKLYRDYGTISSILGKPKTGGKGSSRLDSNQEEIIKKYIKSTYLNSSRTSINKTVRLIMAECHNKNITPPHENTIRNRIKSISEEEVMKKRIGLKEAGYRFNPIRGSFPGADFPLSVVQIDHTRVDIILVDEYYRKPYKRPWLTLAIDVYSRMVVGFHLSFDPPGALGTGLCIAHSILPKEIWLEKIGVKGIWPCWGFMSVIHVDNAKEFRGNMLKMACKNYNINLEFRPIATPHFGGHIERLLGSFSKEVHNLAGTTFSSTELRKNYDSEGRASLTLSEFEKWLTLYITNIYHVKNHSSLNDSPINKWKEGIMGNKEQPGIGIIPRIFNERKLRLDFMPFEERTIQEYGVVIDHVTYYHDVLRKYIHSKTDNIKRKFIFRRDPRDISVVHFYDPESKEYFDIPYRDTSLPAISIWEFRDVLRTLKKNKAPINEKSIFDTYREMDDIEKKAIRETKSRKNEVKNFRDTTSFPTSEIKEVEDKIEDNDIKPFEEIDDEAFI